jgi:hypothetical protein
MAVRITAIHMVQGGYGHEHIEKVAWTNEATSQTGESDVNPTMVSWIDNENGKAYVFDGQTQVDVGTVHPQAGRPYIRTYRDGTYTDNLLALPRY